MIKCLRCGYVHCSDDARAINRFSHDKSAFIAKHGQIPRPTRAEAELDECTWRINNKPQVLFISESALETSGQVEMSEKAIKTVQPFPTSLMEIAAREKAWLDFLAHANISLIVWKIDHSLHGSIDAPTAWLSRCCNELLDIIHGTKNNEKRVGND